MPTASRTHALVLILVLAPVAPGQTTYTWNTNSGTFDSSSSWSPGGVPGATDTALFTSLVTTANVNFAANATTGGLTVTGLNSSATVAFNFNPGTTYTVANSNGFQLGTTSGATANLTLSGGTLALSNSNSGLATVAGSTGNLIIGGASSATVTASGFDIGVNGTGYVRISNGSSFSDGGGSRIGVNARSSGTLLVQDGNYTSAGGNIYVGQSGSGQLQVGFSGGGLATATINSGVIVGTQAGSSGLLLVDGGGVLNTRGTVLFAEQSGAAGNGSAYRGTWNHTNAGMVNRLESGLGTTNLSAYTGGTLNVSGQAGSGINLTAGTGNTLTANGGTINVTGASNGITLQNSNQLNISNGGTVNTVNLIAPGSSLSNFTSGTLNINGGTFSNGSASGFSLASSSGSVALNLNDGATSTLGFLNVQNGGSFTVRSGSILTTPEGVRVGATGSNQATTQFTVTGTGSQANTSASGVLVGIDGGGTLNVSNGGTLNTGGQNLHVGGYNAANATTNTGLVNVSGGTVNLGAGNLILGFGTVNGSGSNGGFGILTLTNGGTINAAFTSIASFYGSTASVTIGNGTGTSTLATSGLRLGGIGGGTASLTVTTNGAVTLPGSGSIGLDSGASVSVTDGGAVTAGAASVGTFPSSATSVVTVGGGTRTSSFTLTDAALSPAFLLGGSSRAILNVTPRGVVTTPTLYVTLNGVVNVSGGTLNVSSIFTTFGTVNLNSGTLNLGADVVNSGTFNHGGGTLNYTDNVTIARAVTINGGTMSVASGKTATFNNTFVNGGTYAGPGTFATSAGQLMTFTNVTTAPSSSLTLAGADNVINSNMGGSTTVTASGATPSFVRTTNTTSGRFSLNSTAQATVSDFVSNGLVTLADGTGTATRTRMTNTGSADLYFGGGSRTFIGTPAGAANGRLATLDLGGRNAVVTGGLFVNNGNVSNGTVVADYGALVKGAGFFANAPITQNGGAFQAGNSPGRVEVGSFVLSGVGQTTGVNQLNFQINNANGVAGPTPDANNQVSGWSLVRSIIDESTGNLSVTATTGDKFRLKLQTLQNPTTVGTDNFGQMANFNNTVTKSWAFITYEGSYTAPADLNTVFNIDASQFQNSLGGGAFSVTHDTAGKVINLTFTPVPEPGVTLLVAAAGLGGLGAWRRVRYPS